MCGEFFPVPGSKPIVIKISQEDKSMEIKIDKEKLKTLHSEGKTDQEIAVVFGVIPGTVWAARKKLGLKCNSTRKPQKNKKTFQKKINKTKDKFSNLIFRDEESNPGMAGVIATLDASIAHHQEKIDKLTQAKNILLLLRWQR
jgi:hypothetical protein